ncbi:TIGR02680 family protein [Cytobacillus sp. NCCP-133]|uniref:TIGR02680 family protein n=1 Tax=Cytobacillus sp. NCCP-133 TaxID=766848 RepID=UPI0022324F0F|nr:TIGR02680 family protein [Cytobacillus sp. NCCP-133]GLB61454.1 TIGR02680 family protein [Cytobacillus sp. NCCP-133]
MADKWKMNRAGLFNFWYYDDEVFDFEDGKLLLRGSNGSGKSVTMQSFLPVLLDGKKSPDRLDPFGSRSRRMADYLLGEKEIANRDERTGYLYLEYKKEHTDQYLTTGIGMQAKRNQTLKSWGFAITDNRRIGMDLELFKWASQDGEKVKFPRSQTELETVIGAGGEVVSSNKEYMALVNKYIFGFETLEAYDDLIKLLIQLRSPKLSKEFKPTVIYEILEEALPPLTDEDLRYLSDSIEQMDSTKQQMEQLEREVKALAKLKDSYGQYNQRILVDKLSDWAQSHNRRQKEQDEVSCLEESLQQLEIEISELSAQRQSLMIQLESLEDKQKQLATHEVFRLEEELRRKQDAFRELQEEIKFRENRITDMARKERNTRKRLDDYLFSLAEKENQLQEAVDDLSCEAEKSAFSGHHQNVEDYMRKKQETFSFDLWKREIGKHTSLLEKALKELDKQELTKKKMEEKNRELGEAQKKRDLAQDEERKWHDTLSEEKQKLIHSIHEWAEIHPHYQIESSTLQEMARLIDDLYTHIEYEDVKEKFLPSLYQYEDFLRNEQSNVKFSQEEAQEELTELQLKWEFRKAQKDPEPHRDEATIKARNQLFDQSVVFAPLYELVEFQPHVSEEVQKRLESALTETGLLDALLTADTFPLKHDRILKAEPKLLSHTLADYLQPDEQQTKIPSAYVQEILQSIEMDGEAPVNFGEDGTYQFASLKGHALPLQEVRFIGREARKRYREELIADLEKQMNHLRTKLDELRDKHSCLEEKLRESRRAWNQFPASAEVKTSYNEMTKAQDRVALWLGEISRITAHVSELDGELQRIKTELFHLTEGITLPLSAESYQTALSNSRQYEKALDSIHREHEALIRIIQDIAREKENLQEVQEDLDKYRGELALKAESLEKTELGISNIQKQLLLAGAEEIRKEIRETGDALLHVKSELSAINERLPQNKEKQNNIKDRLSERTESLKFWNQLEASWEHSLQLDWSRGLFPDRKEPFGPRKLKEYAKEMSKEKTLKERVQLEGNLTALYHSLQPDLIEHKMRLYTSAPDVPDWTKEVSQEEWKPVVEQWIAKNTRNMIEFDQRGVKISPDDLHESISREWSIQENRLDEMDKKLYEEILLNSVGHKLRGRIRRAEKWTEKMRGLMESRDTSSGLKFSIKWRPRTADAEQELDTTELVRLLKQDAKLLNDDDLEKITNHFRSKIQAAKTWLEEKGEGQTLLQVLKMVLDYRKWFSFVLYFERPNEPRRELTNHNFFKFSGGEKAMAMYIPLFTACYSRYQEAAPHAPFVVSLDEAFAGVDENNIKEMFEIVEQLGFNYIMNSQVLWGDYETVKSLSVCELVRPKNANYVTVIRYLWDGHSMNLALAKEAGVL